MFIPTQSFSSDHLKAEQKVKFIFYLNFQILAFTVSGKPGLAVLREKQFLALGASVQVQTQGRQVLGGIRAQGHYVTWQVDCRRVVKDPFFMSERRQGLWPTALLWW